jgi:nucleoside-diphosphate-sugar epimerase
MRIAITGCNGGIGHEVTSMALAAGHSVVGIDRKGAPPASEEFVYVCGDICEYDMVVEGIRGCDAVIHLAAIPGPFADPDHVVHNTNVVGNYNVLRAAVENGIRRVCQASSVNAVGVTYNREPRFDYFPIDENHPNYTEEPYGLSKWISEQQADAFARRYEYMSISSLRFHWVVPNRAAAAGSSEHPRRPRNLWAYTSSTAAAQACLVSLEATFRGHEVFYIVAPDTTETTPTLELVAEHFADVPVRGTLDGNRGLFDCSKAATILGFKHPAGQS